MLGTAAEQRAKPELDIALTRHLQGIDGYPGIPGTEYTQDPETLGTRDHLETNSNTIS